MYLSSVILQNLVLGTQILMVALALYFVFSASRTVHVALGAIGTLAAYAVYFGIISGWPFLASAIFALSVVAVLGLISAELLEPFAARKEPLIGLIVSLAFVFVLESIVGIFFGTDGKNLQQGILPVISFGGVDIDLPGAITIFLGAFLAVTSWLAVRLTDTGRLLAGIAENSELATSLGVNNKNIRRLAHFVAAFIAGIVITLVGWHTSLTPLMGFNFVVVAFIALLIGGNDLRGTAIASYTIAVIPGIIIGFTDGLSENWRLAIVFLIAVIFLAARPQGIFSKKLRET